MYQHEYLQAWYIRHHKQLWRLRHSHQVADCSLWADTATFSFLDFEDNLSWFFGPDMIIRNVAIFPLGSYSVQIATMAYLWIWLQEASQSHIFGLFLSLLKNWTQNEECKALTNLHLRYHFPRKQKQSYPRTPIRTIGKPTWPTTLQLIPPMRCHPPV